MKYTDTVLKFKSIKEFDDWQKDVKNCVLECGWCPNLLDHYYYDNKGRKIKRGRSELIPITIDKMKK